MDFRTRSFFALFVEGCDYGVVLCHLVQVTYGSVIKLQHERTKYRLHSHEVPYGSGSGQQSVTAFPGVEDGNSYWVSAFILHWFSRTWSCFSAKSLGISSLSYLLIGQENTL